MFESFDIAQFQATCLALGLGCLKFLFILGASFIGIWIELLPIPTSWLNYWPMWSPITVLIWSVVLPPYGMIGYAWLLGLVLDGLYGYKLGTHAIGLTVVSYLSYVLQLSHYTDTSERINQLIGVFCVFVLYQLVIWLLKRVTYIPVTALSQRLWTPPLLSTIVWFFLVDWIRTGYDALTSERQFFKRVFSRR